MLAALEEKIQEIREHQGRGEKMSEEEHTAR